jgi:hypothetical protein
VTLGHHLCADQNVDFALSDTLYNLFCPSSAGYVSIEPRNSRSRKTLPEQCLDAFRAHTFFCEGPSFTGGAQVWEARGEVAVVTLQIGATRTMHCQRDSAVWTLGNGPAAPADEAGSEAPAIEEKDGLALVLQIFFDGSMQRETEEWVAARSRSIAGEINDLYQRQLSCVMSAGWQLQASHLARSNREFAAEGWGCRTEHDYGLCTMGTQKSHVACVVAHTFLLFVGAVVFFVDADKSEFAHRREEGGACTDHYTQLS